MRKTTARASAKSDEADALRAIWALDPARSQRAFAEASDLGTPSMISQYLTGNRPLNLKAAVRFAEHLGVPISRFSPRLAAEVRAAIPLVVDFRTEPAAPAFAIIARERLPDEWPWRTVTPGTYGKLSASDKARVEAFVQALVATSKQSAA